MQTPIIVRAVAAGGKFIGDLVGGYVATLSWGGHPRLEMRSHGSSGNTSDLMQQQRLRTAPLPTNPDPVELPLEWAAAAETSVDLEVPQLATITVRGPGKFLDQQQSASVGAWLLPGVGLVGGPRYRNGLVVELPGLLVQNLVADRQDASLSVAANVTMMCGCKIIDNDGIWISSDFTVTAQALDHEGRVLAETPMSYVPLPLAPNDPSAFKGQFSTMPRRAASVRVLAFQHSMANTGLATVAIS